MAPKQPETANWPGGPTRRSSSIRAALCDIARASIRHEAEAEGRRRDDYNAYIASPHWRENPARLAELQAAWGRCRLCNRGPPSVRLEVHHRTYRNLGCERIEDLTTLCGTCHGVVTDMLRQRVRSASPAGAWAWR